MREQEDKGGFGLHAGPPYNLAGKDATRDRMWKTPTTSAVSESDDDPDGTPPPKPGKTTAPKGQKERRT